MCGAAAGVVCACVRVCVCSGGEAVNSRPDRQYLEADGLAVSEVASGWKHVVVIGEKKE